LTGLPTPQRATSISHLAYVKHEIYSSEVRKKRQVRVEDPVQFANGTRRWVSLGLYFELAMFWIGEILKEWD
jgi:hypothetical protein